MSKQFICCQVHLAGAPEEKDPLVVGLPTTLLDDCEEALDSIVQVLRKKFDLTHDQACQRSRALFMHLLANRQRLVHTNVQPANGEPV